MMLRAKYSIGNLYVMTIPDSFGDLYELPAPVLDEFRRILSRDLGIRIEGPSKVSLYVYDNGTFIVESFRDNPVTIQVVTDEQVNFIRDIINDSIIRFHTDIKDESPYSRGEVKPTHSFEVTIMPHSYRVFKKSWSD